MPACSVAVPAARCHGKSARTMYVTVVCATSAQYADASVRARHSTCVSASGVLATRADCAPPAHASAVAPVKNASSGPADGHLSSVKSAGARVMLTQNEGGRGLVWEPLSVHE